MSTENPQLEDGFLKIAIIIVEQFARTQMSGYESRLVWFLLRKTYGWGKKKDRISLSQWVDGTGISRKHVINTIQRLVSRNIILKSGTEIRTRKAAEYQFNKHSAQWKVVPKTVPKVAMVPKSVLSLVPKTGHTIDTTDTKDKREDIVVLQSKGGEMVEIPTLFGSDPEPEKKTRKSKAKDVLPEVAEVLAYLNEKIGAKYSVSPDLTARIRKGATVEQAKVVIDKKVAEWQGTEMAQYLKPSTLFCAKHFDEYLNQPAVRVSVGSRHVSASWPASAYLDGSQYEKDELERVRKLDEATGGDEG